jgi:hypothetical protein
MDTIDLVGATLFIFAIGVGIGFYSARIYFGA